MCTKPENNVEDEIDVIEIFQMPYARFKLLYNRPHYSLLYGPVRGKKSALMLS